MLPEKWSIKKRIGFWRVYFHLGPTIWHVANFHTWVEAINYVRARRSRVS